jgi:hypothetical protein
MLFQRISRTTPEKIFIVVKNSYSTAALSNGQAVVWDFNTDADGVGVTMATARATNAGVAIAGVAAEAIAAGDYGLLQVYGYHSAVRVRSITGGSPAIAAGSPLALNAAGSVFCLESWDTGSTNLQVHSCGFALAAQASWTTKTIAAFLKCL